MQKTVHFIFILLMGALTSFFVYGQGKKTLAEQLGYAKDSRLLIVHADDLGVAHSENRATLDALEKGAINSASIMVPCPWFPEIASYAREHPLFDWGLHLTITSEWKHLRWDGVADSQRIPGLINKQGYFYETVEEAVKHGTAADVEKEIRAQIEKAISFGIKPTHLDPHMNGLFSSHQFFATYFQLGKEYRIPVLVPMNLLQDSAFRRIAGDYPAIIVSHIQLHPGIPADRWQEAYDSTLINMKPGLNELVLHLAYNDDEMKAVTSGKTHWWDAAWRQRDYDYITSQRFKEVLRKNNIQLVTWKQIGVLLYP